METGRASGRKEMYNSYSDTQYEDERYGASHMLSYLERRSRIINAAIGRYIGSNKQCRILDMGCGTGLNLRNIRRAFPDAVIHGTDIATKMLQLSLKKFRDERLNISGLVNSSALSLPYQPDMFDCLVTTRFIHQFRPADKKSIFCEVRRVLKPGGIAVIEFYMRPYHWVRYYATGDKRSRESYFSHFPSGREVREAVWGSYEKFPVRLVGSRLIHGLLGGRFLDTLSDMFSSDSLMWLYDEYIVVIKK